MMTSTIRKFGVGVASIALVAGAVAPAFAAGGEQNVLPNGTSVMRLSGDNRVDTSIAVAKKRMKEGLVTKAYLVGYDAVADAASAGSLNDGVLIVAPQDKASQLLLGKIIMDDADLTNITELVAIGGKNVLPDSVLDNIKKFDTKIVKTSRIEGENRYETSAAIAKKSTNASKVYMTRGDVLVDALAAGSLKDGPILLVNPSGDVDPSVVKYYQGSGVSKDNVIILGGDSALTDAQVQKVVGEKESVSPWKFVETEAQLKLEVKKAAALYFGNEAWQGQKTNLQPNPDKADMAFFGYDNSITFAPTAASVVDPRLVTTDKLETAEGAKAFVGYKPTFDKLSINATGIQGKYNTLKATFDQVLNDQIAAKSDHATADAALADSFKALYGIAVVNAAHTGTAGQDDFKITNADQATFTYNRDNQITGVNASLVAKINKDAKDVAGSATVAQIDSADAVAVAGYTAGSLKAVIENAKGFEATNKDDSDGKRINWVVLNELTQKRLAEQKSLTETAKANLEAAVAKYSAAPWEKVVTQAKGVKRIVGDDRYSTSALVSYYATTSGGVDDDEVYMASGEDGNLIDSVVAGQLTKGTIVLLPKSEALGDDTKAELKRLAKKTLTLTAYVIGGDKAVTDDTVKAVAAAMR